jgi:glucan 1,3-beta-glucosidase
MPRALAAIAPVSHLASFCVSQAVPHLWMRRLHHLSRGTTLIIVALAVVTVIHPTRADSPPLIHGINFSPYSNFPIQDPPPAPPDFVPKEKIESLLSIVRPRTSWIRTFGAESGLEEIPEVAHNMGLGVAMGAFLGPDTTVNANQINKLISKATDGFVDIAVVGNETQVFGALTETQLVGYLQDVRQQLDDAGFTDVPVTTAEPFGTFVNNLPGSIFNSDGSLKKPDIIANVDIVFLNVYPFFEAGIQITDAVSKLEEMYYAAVDSIDAAFPGQDKQVVISETGWPSAGDPPAIGGMPSLENAIQYLNQSVEWAGDHGVELFYFQAFDEDWKGPADFEKHFGIWEADGHLKMVPEPSSIVLLALGMAGLFAGLAPTPGTTRPSSGWRRFYAHRARLHESCRRSLGGRNSVARRSPAFDCLGAAGIRRS